MTISTFWFRTFNFNIFPFITPGSTFQIRFAETDNQLFLNQGIDNVSILVDSVAIPEPTSLTLFFLGLAGIVGIRRKVKHL